MIPDEHCQRQWVDTLWSESNHQDAITDSMYILIVSDSMNFSLCFPSLCFLDVAPTRSMPFHRECSKMLFWSHPHWADTDIRFLSFPHFPDRTEKCHRRAVCTLQCRFGVVSVPLGNQLSHSFGAHKVHVNPYWTTDVLIFNVLNMDRKTREIGPLSGISLPDIHMDL